MPTSADLRVLGFAASCVHPTRMTPHIHPPHTQAPRLNPPRPAGRQPFDDEMPPDLDSRPTTLEDFGVYDDFDARQAVEELYEELADYNDSAARSDEGAWFYSDDD